MREVSDLAVSAGVRRELAGRRIDLSKIKFPVVSGNLTIQGELAFVGFEKNADETAIELKFLEASLKGLMGVKSIKFELTNWKKNDAGIWEESSKGANGKAKIEGEGIVCPECDFVIRFCPCCGKPLGEAKCGTASSIASSMKTKRAPLPVMPIVRKKRPLTDSATGSVGTSPMSATTSAPVSPINSATKSAITPKPAVVAPKLNSVMPAVDKASVVGKHEQESIQTPAASPIAVAKPETAVLASNPTQNVVSAPSASSEQVTKPAVSVPVSDTASAAKSAVAQTPASTAIPAFAPMPEQAEEAKKYDDIPKISFKSKLKQFAPEAETKQNAPTDVSNGQPAFGVPNGTSFDINSFVAPTGAGNQQKQESGNSAQDAFNPFAQTNTTNSKPAFDPFASLNSEGDGFSFEQPKATENASSALDPFASLNTGSGLDLSQPASQPAQQEKPAFDPFASLNAGSGLDLSQPASQPAQQEKPAFDPFASLNAGSDFDFSQPASQPAQQEKPAFDPFASLNAGNDLDFSQPASQPAQQENPAFDPFAMGGQDQQANNNPVQNANPFGSNPFGSDPFAASNDAQTQQPAQPNQPASGGDPFAGFSLGDIGAGDSQPAEKIQNDPFANFGGQNNFSFPAFDNSQQPSESQTQPQDKKPGMKVPEFNFDELLGGSNQGTADSADISGMPAEDGGMQVFNLDGGFEDDTPLPPMKSQAPAASEKPKAKGKKNQDMFASLFQGNDGSNGFGNIDFDLDVEVVPTGDGSGSAPSKQSSPQASSDPFDVGVFDLDAPIAPSGSGGKKGKSSLNFDDLDLSKFNI